MLTAEEARNKAISNRNKAAEIELAAISKQICQAVEKGELYITLSDLSTTSSEFLRNLGYDVERYSMRNEVTIKISW